MLSWSSHASETRVDLRAIVAGHGEAGVPLSTQLLAFASAAADVRRSAEEMEQARDALVAAADRPTMIDAAAVAANFQMMTRLADGTGAKLAPMRLADVAPMLDVIEASDMTSRR